MSPLDRCSGSVRKLPASIACSIVRIAGSGWYSARRGPRRARGLERLAQHPRHGLVGNITSTGNSGSSWRAARVALPGTSALVNTVTTPGS